MIRSVIAVAVVATTALSPVAARRTDLTLSHVAETGHATAVKLRCDPAGGAHPTPAQACAVLKQVGGRPDRLRPARIMCILIYAPITAEITGIWRGQKIHWSKTYGNTCELSRATGVLFRF
jgi:Subtilisin inhibitor-like